MRRYWLILLLLAVTSVHAQELAPHQCGIQVEQDDADDVTMYPDLPPPPGADTAPLDVLELRLWVSDDVLHYEGDLAAAPPRDTLAERYRYWFGFHVVVDGEPLAMDLRLHDGPDYAKALLTAPNAYDNVLLDRIASEWDGDTVRFAVPLRIIRTGLGLDDALVGTPFADTDGPHRTSDVGPVSTPQGAPFSAPYMTDHAGGFRAFSPHEPCEPAEDPAVATGAVAAVPSAGWTTGGFVAGTVVGAGLLAVVRRTP